MKEKKNLLELRSFSRRVAQEGLVILENKNNLLPIINEKVAIYGRIQTNYYKSGTGSGGLVNVTDVPSIIEAAIENPRLDVNEDVVKLYQDWVKENPFNAGNGMWASEPWSQKEMEVPLETIVAIKRQNEIPIMVIGRTAGEDRDNYDGEGSYRLTKIEYGMIEKLKKVYGKVVVVLNVGNIIDTNFSKELNVDGLVYAWHGGQDGARAIFDVLTGYIEPSGKLPNTIFKTLDKYVANNYFGNKEKVYYEEDIYVGYRYFETFMPEEVLYPFGYGLTYTNFKIKSEKVTEIGNELEFYFKVENIGDRSGKNVVQMYLSSPQGKLGKPKYELIGFVKTQLIQPGESETVKIKVDLSKSASYDDVGLVSKSCYVLEKGKYKIYYGEHIKDLVKVHTVIKEEDEIVETLQESLAPREPFKRVKPVKENDEYIINYEDVPLTNDYNFDIDKRVNNQIDEISKKTGKEKYKLIEVFDKKVTMEEFVNSLSIEDMMHIIFGEGMSSPKVTPGTASAFGGITDSLREKKIPLVCSADGPSGIRMDSGGIATSLPNGTLIASTFNPSLVEELYYLEAKEMRNYNIDILLGPGMNIHRHPLNGRNFEYFSEDPLLTGMMASSVIRGLNKGGVFGAMKHFIANNQETARTDADSIVSERALREIYLKGFEIAVKESKASVIMTAYNPINGIWAASNYDLNTKILREEWGFEGIVMTDWWAKMNDNLDLEGNRNNIRAMIKAQNDLYKVVPNVLEHKSNLEESLKNGTLKIEELKRSVKNILNFATKTNAFKKENNIEETLITKEINFWFESSNKIYEYPLIDGKRETTLSESFNLLEDEFDLVEKKNKVTFALINKKEQTLYNFGITKKEQENEITKIIESIKMGKVYELSDVNWEKVDFDLASVSYRTPEMRSYNNIKKDSMFTFRIAVKEFGKYVIGLEISSEQSEVTQMPFSVFVDDENKQTLTTNGTSGKKVWITSMVIIEKENKFLTFKFHKTGINIHSINIAKHG